MICEYQPGDKVTLVLSNVPSYIRRMSEEYGIVHTVDGSSTFNCIHLSNNIFGYNFETDQVQSLSWKERYNK